MCWSPYADNLHLMRETHTQHPQKFNLRSFDYNEERSGSCFGKVFYQRKWSELTGGQIFNILSGQLDFQTLSLWIFSVVLSQEYRATRIAYFIEMLTTDKQCAREIWKHEDTIYSPYDTMTKFWLWVFGRPTILIHLRSVLPTIEFLRYIWIICVSSRPLVYLQFVLIFFCCQYTI